MGWSQDRPTCFHSTEACISQCEIFELVSKRDGTRLSLTSYGSPNGLPAILLHGGGQTQQTWNDTCMVLAERGYRAISYDQRGHGQSDWAPSGDYSIDAFVDDLKTVTATLEVPPILIGASLGGIVSLIAGGEAPTIPVQAMVLVDIATSTASGGVDRIFNFMNGHPNGFGTVEEAVDAVSTYLPGRERPRDPARLIKNLRSQGDRLYWHWDPEFVATAVRRHDAHMARASHAAGQIACPLLLIHGAQSDVTTESEIADLLARIPHARSTTIQDAHHMVVGDQSTVFSMAVSDFLDKQLSLERFEAARAFPRELIPKLAGRDS